MKINFEWPNVIRFLLIYLFCIGAIGHLVPVSRDIFLQTTPYILLLVNIGVLIFALKHSLIQAYIWCAGIILFTYTIEVLGVNTGSVFGEYTYSNVLGLSILGAPPLIGLMWVNIVLGSIGIVDVLFRHVIVKIIMVIGLTVLFDFFLEPVAIELGYWEWSGGIVPYQNYIAWGLISAVIALSYYLLHIKIDLTFHRMYYLGNLLFVLLLLVFDLKL